MVREELKKIIEETKVALTDLKELLTELELKHPENRRIRISLSDIDRCIEIADYLKNNEYEFSNYNLHRATVKLIDSIDRNDFGVELSEEFIQKRGVIISDLWSYVNRTSPLLLQWEVAASQSGTDFDATRLAEDKGFTIPNRTETSEEYLADFEATFEIKVPQVYKDFLATYGAGASNKRLCYIEFEPGDDLEFDIGAFLGSNPDEMALDLKFIFSMSSDLFPDGYFPIAEGGGCYIAIGLDGDNKDKIFVLWRNEFDPITTMDLLEDSLEDFINRLQ